jgi:hypothetical protein
MTVIGGKFDGTSVVLDQVPKGLRRNTRVQVVIKERKKRPHALDLIAALAEKANLPKDFAAQHEHYTKGTPKR